MNTTMRNLLIAVGLFLIGIMLVTSYISGQSAKLEKGNDYVRVLVAKKDIPAGTSASQLKSGGYLEEQKVLRRDATPQAIHDISTVKKLSTRQNVYPGQQLSAYQFETQSGLNPTEQIKGTERLVALHIAPSGTVATLIKPGDHIDVFGSGDPVYLGPMERKAAKKLGINQGLLTNVKPIITWLAVRDAIVLQTPDSLAGPTDPNAKKAPVKAKGDDELYVLQVSDEGAQSLLWTQANTDEDMVQFTLRPSDGAEESTLDPLVTTPDVN